MEFNRLRPEAKEQFPPSEPPVEREAHLIKAAPLTEVMFEQLEYLITHASGHCPKDCFDCHRLERVQNWLLLPFRSV